MTKIETTSSAQKATLRRLTKTGSSSSASFSPSLGEMNSPDESAQVSGPVPASSLFLLQEVSERETAKNHGDKILNMLDRLRFSLLSGDIQDTHLFSLKAYLISQNAVCSEPRLKAVLAEIEQRANIELAKRGLI